MMANRKMITHKMASVVLGSGALLLAGCASQPDYRCEIPEDCAPVHQNYELAVSDEQLEGWVSQGADPSLPPGVEDPSKRAKEIEDEVNSRDSGLFGGWFSRSEKEKRDAIRPFVRGEVDVHEGPVFIPPKPHRIWLGHWKGENGELNSGNYTYLTTPGYYLYMGDKYLALPYGVDEGGAAAAETFNGLPRATFSPVRPTNYGFEPEEAKAPKGTLDGMVQPDQEG